MTPTYHALIPGHGRKATWDPGAVADLNGDGDIDAAETEAYRNAVICEAARDALHAAGQQVRVFAEGSYADRVKAAAAWAAGNRLLVLHIHHDGHGCGGRAVYHHRDSVPGASAADPVAGVLGDALSEAVHVVAAYDDRKTASKPWLFNAAYLCRLTWDVPRACSVVVEALSVDDPRELDGVVGRALGRLA